jgi:hypothetical protein
LTENFLNDSVAKYLANIKPVLKNSIISPHLGFIKMGDSFAYIDLIGFSDL